MYIPYQCNSKSSGCKFRTFTANVTAVKRLAVLTAFNSCYNQNCSNTHILSYLMPVWAVVTALNSGGMSGISSNRRLYTQYNIRHQTVQLVHHCNIRLYIQYNSKPQTLRLVYHQTEGCTDSSWYSTEYILILHRIYILMLHRIYL